MYTYEITTGRLYDNNLKLLGVGYSGNVEHKNNPASQNLVDQGPIVEGNYVIAGPAFDSNLHGKYCLRLIPDDATRDRILAYGRDPWSFLMHGDSVRAPGTASEGCVIQAHDVRTGVGGNLAVDKDFQVVAVLTHPDINGEISV